MAVAETRDVVFVAAEGGFGGLLLFSFVAGEFELVRAELVVDDGPDDFVRGHGWVELGLLCRVFRCLCEKQSRLART